MVPSVSEAQKRNLLSDPFFQTASLFDASSVESARSAARDLSLFKPHLKASVSSSQSRRQGPSSSSGRTLLDSILGLRLRSVNYEKETTSQHVIMWSLTMVKGEPLPPNHGSQLRRGIFCRKPVLPEQAALSVNKCIPNSPR